MNFVSRIRDVIEQERLIEPSERILLGLSGGIDSTVLLHVLCDLRTALSFDVGIAHINHLLRGEESERDEEFVRSLGRTFALPCYVARVDVRKEARDSGKSLQHAGRDVRYGFFRETATRHGFQKIGVAHILDDQVETFILRMLKGTGMRGLSAIPVKRDNIVRPFLGVRRTDIEEHARIQSIPFVNDSSNEKIVYERNFIRKQITPWMEKLNPAFREKILLLLKDLTAVNRVFDAKAEDFAGAFVKWERGDASLPVKELKVLDDETRFRVMAGILGRVEPGFIPLREHMRQIDNVIGGARPNLSTALPHGLRIRKTYGILTVTEKSPRAPSLETFPVSRGTNRLEEFCLNLQVVSSPGACDGPALAPGPDSAFFDEEKIGTLSVRIFREGDRFVPLGMRASVKLKDFFISRKIPREERRHIPLLMSGNDIIWVIGHRIDDRYKATGETTRRIAVYANPISS